ncbi:MAG: thioredoxin family protein [Pyrinomonadaceae bacterium]|nr:thioredoxin family protein [Pyrinomonadaceae bacterium]
MKKLVRFALVVTLLVAYFPSARSSAAPTLPNVTGEAWLNGAAGYARAVELQKQLNVPLVVYFYTDWCPYCRTLDNKYLPSAPVQDYLRGVVKVRINPEHGQAERALSNRFGVNGYPSFFVMRHSATRPVNVHPFRKVGNLTPTEFANACRAVGPIARNSMASRSSGISGKFRERSEVVTKVATTKGGGQIVTVVPIAPPPKARDRKQ